MKKTKQKKKKKTDNKLLSNLSSLQKAIPVTFFVGRFFFLAFCPEFLCYFSFDLFLLLVVPGTISIQFAGRFLYQRAIIQKMDLDAEVAIILIVAFIILIAVTVFGFFSIFEHFQLTSQNIFQLFQVSSSTQDFSFGLELSLAGRASAAAESLTNSSKADMIRRWSATLSPK